MFQRDWLMLAGRKITTGTSPTGTDKGCLSSGIGLTEEYRVGIERKWWGREKKWRDRNKKERIGLKKMVGNKGN